MEYNHNLIKEITEDFVFQTCKNEIPDGYCFSLCFPLSVLFSLMGIEHELTFGKAKKNNIEVSHFWITFDINGFIVDPTIKQFNENESSVYVGDIQKNETTKRYIKIEIIGDEEFSKTYEMWTESILQIKNRRSLPNDFESKIITLNVATSQVLFFYINKYGLKEKLLNSNYALAYFKPIGYVYQQKEIVENVLFYLNKNSLNYKQEIIKLAEFN